ncbi:MAG: hypothetical protein ACFFBD_07630 [Candidatus Hodarchaeota archaeon]
MSQLAPQIRAKWEFIYYNIFFVLLFAHLNLLMAYGFHTISEELFFIAQFILVAGWLLLLIIALFSYRRAKKGSLKKHHLKDSPENYLLYQDSQLEVIQRGISTWTIFQMGLILILLGLSAIHLLTITMFLADLPFYFRFMYTSMFILLFGGLSLWGWIFYKLRQISGTLTLTMSSLVTPIPLPKDIRRIVFHLNNQAFECQWDKYDIPYYCYRGVYYYSLNQSCSLPLNQTIRLTLGSKTISFRLSITDPNHGKPHQYPKELILFAKDVTLVY